jgi:hypothetical protein
LKTARRFCNAVRDVDGIQGGVGERVGWRDPLRRGVTALNGRRRRVHFVGIGGIGMSGIAEVLLTQGYAVSGSDVARATPRAASRASARRSSRARTTAA